MEKPNRHAFHHHTTDRTKALTDGIFAVAMTILVLDIDVPLHANINSESDALQAILHLTPKILSYFLSFLSLGIMWLAHNTQIKYIEYSNRSLIWITITFLFFVCLVPFSTAFLSEHFRYKTPAGLYVLNLFLINTALSAHWYYALQKGFVSVPENQKKTIAKVMRNKLLMAQTGYVIGGIICLFNNYIGVGVIFALQTVTAFTSVGNRYEVLEKE